MSIFGRKYESEGSGRFHFTWEWKIEGAYIAEFECAVDYRIRFGEEPSGYGIHYDPGSGDEIQITDYWVTAKKSNPAWKNYEGDVAKSGLKPYLEITYPMPASLNLMIVADAEAMKRLDEDISDYAREQRQPITRN